MLKTKLLVAGIGLTNDNLAPLELDGGVVEVVKQFKYLGLLVEALGGVVGEVSCRILKLLALLPVYVILCLLHQIRQWRPRGWCTNL